MNNRLNLVKTTSFLFLVLIIISCPNDFNQIYSFQPVLTNTHLSYKNASNNNFSDPFNIIGNQNFTDFAISHKWPGNGSKGNPFIIENNIFSSNSSDFSRMIELRNITYFIIIRNNTFLDTGLQGIAIVLVSCVNIIVENNNFYEIDIGIAIESSYNCLVFNNTLMDLNTAGTAGIGLWGSDYSSYSSINYNNNNNISFYIIFNFYSGILINSISNIIIQNNLLYNLGIAFLTNSNNNLFVNNYVMYCTAVLSSFGISGNQFKGNAFVEDSYGLIFQNSGNNLVTFNFISNITNYIVKTINPTLIDNVFYGNTFLHLKQNSFFIGSYNKWDNGSYGNYWDNYNGSDTDSNGIGDQKYEIYPSIYDNFPLIYRSFNPIIPKVQNNNKWLNSNAVAVSDIVTTDMSQYLPTNYYSNPNTTSLQSGPNYLVITIIIILVSLLLAITVISYKKYEQYEHVKQKLRKNMVDAKANLKQHFFITKKSNLKIEKNEHVRNYSNYCPNCKAPIQIIDIFCFNCGKRITRETTQSDE